MLPRLEEILHDKTRKNSVPFSILDYHLMHKLQILHGGTHVGRVMTEGRPLSADMALSAVQDLLEVLRSVGVVKTN